MTFKEYQDSARKTSNYSDKYRLLYPAMGLAGEAGEVANKIQKLMRDKDMILDEDDRLSLAKELGDCLWFISAMADDLEYDIEDIAKINIEKLASRYSRGLIGGSGDNR